jgi:hypothetical protein
MGNEHSQMVFMQLRLQATVVHVRDPDGQEDWYAPADHAEYSYYDPIVVLRPHELPIDEDSTIYVHSNLRFEGQVVATDTAPREWGEFTRYMALDAEPREQGPRQPPRAPVPRGDIVWLLEDNPWLAREDLMPLRHATRRVERRGGGGGDGPPDPPDESDGSEHDSEPGPDEDDDDGFDLAVDAMPALHAERALLAVTDSRYFRTTLLGGAWTMAHIGDHSDAAKGMACSRRVEQWCRRFQFPRTRQFTYNRYGRYESKILAEEFTRRGNWFCALFMGDGAEADAFTYTQDMVDDYPEDLGFVNFLLDLDVDGDAFDAGVALRRLHPVLG